MNNEQFAEIVEQYQSPIISVIQKMVVSWDIARDLAQDSFIRLWDYRDKIISDKPLFTLLYRIAMNISIDYLRKTKPESIDFELQSTNSDSQNLESREFFQIILNCSDKLKPKQKAVFVLRDIEGFSFDEIRKIMKMPVTNIRSNLYLARKNIKTILESKYQFNKEMIYDL